MVLITYFFNADNSIQQNHFTLYLRVYHPFTPEGLQLLPPLLGDLPPLLGDMPGTNLAGADFDGFWPTLLGLTLAAEALWFRLFVWALAFFKTV